MSTQFIEAIYTIDDAVKLLDKKSTGRRVHIATCIGAGDGSVACVETGSRYYSSCTDKVNEKLTTPYVAKVLSQTPQRKLELGCGHFEINLKMSSWDRIIKSSQSAKPSSVLTTMESRDFLQKVKRLGELDETSQILYKDARQLGERELEAFKAEKKLVTDLTNSLPVREDVSLKDGLCEWNEYIRHQEEYLNTMTSNTNRVIVEPVKRLLSVFPNIQASIKKRDQLLMEYEKWQQRVDKQKKKERSGPNIMKLESLKESLNAAKEEFETANNELVAHMSDLYEQRTDYITPSIHALIKLQICNIGEGFKGYTELQEQFRPHKPHSADPSEIVDKFSEFKSLSIVSTDTV